MIDLKFKCIWAFFFLFIMGIHAANYTIGQSHFGLSSLIGANGTMGTLTYQQPSTANARFNSVVFNLGWFPGPGGAAVSGYIFVLLPESWTATYYSPNSDISVNWTSTLSTTYNVSIYTENGTFVKSVVNSTPFYNALWINATPDGFYYAQVTACDGLVCATNTSAVFGVYTPTITISFGASALPNGTTISTDNYTEYCDYSFYPGRTSARAGAVNFFISNSSIYKISNTLTPGPSGTDVPFAFNGMITGEFGRYCYGVNIYNSTVDGDIRQIRFIVSTVVPFNTMDTFLIISVIILLIFLATSLSNIKIIGVVGAVLLLLLGMWVITDNLYYKIGTSGLKYQTNQIISGNFTVGNTTINTTTTGAIINVDDSTTTRYQEIQVPNVAGTAGVKAKDALGLTLVLLGIYALLYYALGIFGYQRR